MKTLEALLLLCIALGTTESKPKAEECVDSNESCAQWAKRHECVSNPFYMRAHCRKACNACERHDITHTHAWPGHATELATRHYATMLPGVSNHAHGHFRKDPSMGSFTAPGQRVRGSPWLTLSSLGTGTYLGDEDAATDEAVTSSIIMAVSHGMNVVDTARNYRGGRGENSVGRALTALLQHPGLKREMLFVSTKAGFLVSEALQKLVSKGRISQKDITAGSHCIAPACLEISLHRSLKALHLQTVDVLYLHNVAEMRQAELQGPGFWQGLEDAFKWLEAARADGKLRAYGLASWSCFRLAPTESGFLSLKRVVALAERVGGPEHGFRYIQLPVNAGMLEAVTGSWQPLELGRSVTLLEAAAELGVGVFASGPLGEGSLLGDPGLAKKLGKLPQLSQLGSVPAQLLQISRSAPLLLGAVVGQKSKAHVEENLSMATVQPLSEGDFARAVKALRQ